VRSFKNVGVAPPLIVESGSGAVIVDADGREYIDYCMSWGSLILGHAHPEIVKRQWDKCGLALLSHCNEFGSGDGGKDSSLLPGIEKSRLVSSGTEATMTAIRLARGFTKKPKILNFPAITTAMPIHF